MSTIHNCRGIVCTYLSMMNDIVLSKLGQHVSGTITLILIVIFQVLGSALFYNPHLELAVQEKTGVTQQVFGQWAKDCVNMDIWPP